MPPMNVPNILQPEKIPAPNRTGIYEPIVIPIPRIKYTSDLDITSINLVFASSWPGILLPLGFPDLVVVRVALAA